jgi:hypothetical protein
MSFPWHQHDHSPRKKPVPPQEDTQARKILTRVFMRGSIKLEGHVDLVVATL